MKKALIVLAGLVLIVFIVGISFVGIYNQFVGMNEKITSQWAQVETQLQRRNDLIPNLVSTVKGYASHEKEIFENIAAARAKLAGANTVDKKIEADNEMESALSRLLVVVENYPNLKANENFIRLQDELAGTENRIAVERRRYNSLVQDYNINVKRFPSNLVANMTGFKENTAYFKAAENAKTPPAVNF
jgi:LemA protein